MRVFKEGIENLEQLELRFMTYKNYRLITLSKSGGGYIYFPVITVLFDEFMNLLAEEPEDLDIIHITWNKNLEILVPQSVFYHWRDKDYYNDKECEVNLTVESDTENKGLYVRLILPNTMFHWVIDFNTMEVYSYDRYCYECNNWKEVCNIKYKI